MRKLLIALICATTIAAFSTIKPDKSATQTQNSQPESFGYGSLGFFAPVPIPTAAVGYRIKDNLNTAVDISANVTTIFIGTSLESHFKVLNYLNRRDYYGIGASIGCSFGTQHFYHGNIIVHGEPVFTLGRESKKNFKELNIKCPTVTNHGIVWIPMISFRYGWKY